MKLDRVSKESSAKARSAPAHFGELAQRGGGGVGRALYVEKRLDQRPLLQADAGAVGQRGLLQKALGDFAGAAAADRRNAGDGQHVLDQLLRAGGVDIGQRRQHAGANLAIPARARRERLRAASPRAKPISKRRRQAGGRPRRSRKVFTSPASPSRIFSRRGAGSPSGVERDAQNFRVGGLAVLAAEALQPRLRGCPSPTRKIAPP